MISKLCYSLCIGEGSIFELFMGFKVAVTRQAEPNDYTGHFPKEPRIFLGGFPFFEKQNAYRFVRSY
jgi:hypothetical protein